MATETVFSLLTFNCFGGFDWTMPRRLRTLARELDTHPPNVVCLQEVQTHLALRLLLRASTKFHTQAYVHGPRAPRGSLLTLVRDAILGHHFTRFETQGAWFAPTIMDQLTQKGALVSEFEHHGVKIRAVNTHLIANYMGNWRPESRAARDQQSQLHQLAALIQSQPRDALVLVAGDFNLPRGNWLYEEFLSQSGLQDPLAGDLRPTYRPFPGVPARYALPIDFVFVRPPTDLPVQMDAKLHFDDKLAMVDGRTGYLSDHIGVQVTLRWSSTTT